MTPPRAARKGGGPLFRRTEAQVAADTAIAIFHSGLLPKTAKVLAFLAQATRLPVSALKEANGRWTRGAWRAPSAEECAVRPALPPELESNGSPSPAPPIRSQSVRVARTNVERKLETTPAPGRRRCARCGQTKAASAFDVKNHATGALRSYCRPCQLEYQRDRYLSVAKAEEIDHLRLEFEAHAGDAVIGTRCAGCAARIREGQVVVVDGAPRHKKCTVAP